MCLQTRRIVELKEKWGKQDLMDKAAIFVLRHHKFRKIDVERTHFGSSFIIILGDARPSQWTARSVGHGTTMTVWILLICIICPKNSRRYFLEFRHSVGLLSIKNQLKNASGATVSTRITIMCTIIHVLIDGHWALSVITCVLTGSFWSTIATIVLYMQVLDASREDSCFWCSAPVWR